MSRVGIWVANAVLIALCAFLAANIVNEVAAEWLAGSPAALASPEGAAGIAPGGRKDRQVILSRNLFNVSTLQPAALQPEDEELEATQLPLVLRGTVASENPALAWAAVEDTESRRNLVVRVDDRLLDRATVLRIERRRIVLQNGPRREELALTEDETPPPPVRRVSRPAPRARSAARTARQQRQQRLQERVRQLSENRFAVPRAGVEDAARNPASLFSQARILPKYESGEMVGVQVNAIQPGSLFEQIGIEDGDVITELNGVQVTSPQDSANLLRELTDAQQFTVVVRGANGSERTLNYEIQE